MLEELPGRDDALFIHMMLDDLMTESEWETVDTICMVVDPTRYSVDMVLSVLVATKPAAEHLPHRAVLYQQSLELLTDHVSPDILKRLE